MSEIDLPTSEQAKEDALRDAQAGYQAYQVQAQANAEEVVVVVVLRIISSIYRILLDHLLIKRYNNNNILPLNHPIHSIKNHEVIHQIAEVIHQIAQHHHHLLESIYGSPLSVNTELYQYSPSTPTSPLHTPKGHPIEKHERDGGMLGTAGKGLMNMVHNVTTGNMQIDQANGGGGWGGAFGALKGLVGGGGGDGGDGGGGDGKRESDVKGKKWVGSYGQKVRGPPPPPRVSIPPRFT